MPVKGRCLPVWEEVHRQQSLAQPAVHEAFLRTLRSLVPADSRPILITDAGFKLPRFRAAESLGFSCIGRLRGTVLVRPVGEAEWVPVRAYQEYEGTRILDLGLCEIGKGPRKPMRLIVVRKPPKGRVHRTVDGRRAKDSRSRKQAAGARESWVLLTSAALPPPGSSTPTGAKSLICQ